MRGPAAGRVRARDKRLPGPGLLVNERGLALLLTIVLISLIVALTLQFNTGSRQDVFDAANLRDGVRLGMTARSAFNLAREVLYRDARESSLDSLNERWAQLPALSSCATTLLGGQQVELAVADHSARIQINALVNAENGEVVQQQRELLDRLLRSEEFGLSSDQVEAILEALQDWLDPDDEVSGLSGAEAAYYQSLDPPYACRNGPLEFIEELLLVKGITRELFYGTETKPGLRDFVTACGNDGRININTAAPLVLRALTSGIDARLAESLTTYRANRDNDLASPNWYRQVPGFPGDIEIAPGLLTVESRFFEIKATASLGTMARQVEAVVQRSADGRLTTIAWKLD